MKLQTKMQTLLLVLAVCGACTDEKQELVSKVSPPGEAAQPVAAKVESQAVKPTVPAVTAIEAKVAMPTQPAAAPEVEAQEVVPSTAAGSVAGLEIKRVVFTQGVVDREPVDTATSFSHAQTPKVWMFLELANNSTDTLLLDVSWENPEGKAGHPVELSVPASKRWRTQSFTSTDKKPGTYRCVVRAKDGTVLVDQKIDITA